MSENLCKTIIKLLINKLFSFQFEELKENDNYVELLKIIKEVEGLPPQKLLMVYLCEFICIENNKLKEIHEEEEPVKFFIYYLDKKRYQDSCLQKQLLSYIEYDKYTKIFQPAKIFTAKEILLLSFISKIKNDFSVLFKCINLVYSLKSNYYILPREDIFFKDDFNEYLEDLELFFSYNDFENEKKYYSLGYNKENAFHFIYYDEDELNLDEIENIKTKNSKDIKKYILSNSREETKTEKKLNIKDVGEDADKNNEKKENNSNIFEFDKKEKEKESKVIKSEQEELMKFLDDRLNKVLEELNEQKSKIFELKKEISDRDNAIRKIKQSHQYEINKLNNRYSKLSTSFQVYKDAEKEKNNDLKQKLNDSKLSNNLLKKENLDKDIQIKEISGKKDLLQEKIDTINSRNIVMAILDFFVYIFDELRYDQSYSIKKDNIIMKINEKIKDNREIINVELLKNLINFINKIYQLKINGDGYAHPLIEINVLFKLANKGYEKVIDLLKKLDLYEILKKFDELYEEKQLEKDYSLIESEIKDLLIEKKDTFLILIQKN